MQSNLVNFIQVLRSHDVRVSPAETLDAMDVATTLGYSDRSLLRDGLALALAKTAEEEVIFLDCFDRFFQQDLADFSGSEENAQATHHIDVRIDVDLPNVPGRCADRHLSVEHPHRNVVDQNISR